MKQRSFILSPILILVFSSTLWALDYPGKAPGKASRSVAASRAFLENAVLRGEWKLNANRIGSLIVKNKHTGQTVTITGNSLPRIVLTGDIAIDLASLRPEKQLHLKKHAIVAAFKDNASGLTMRWSASLDDGANAIIQTLQLTASQDTRIKEVVFVDAPLAGARQAGSVDGSVVVCGDVFLAVEHPLAKNTVSKGSHLRCVLPRGNVLKAGQSWTHTSVIGVVPPGQLRRGFLYYLERRRGRRYRQFLHYNNWYDVVLARPTQRATEAECLKILEFYGRELVRKRGVKMDAFVWDDGWDDFNSLWKFHKGFPNGFKGLKDAGAKYGAAQGVWMSPWGGYARAKNRRIAYGKKQGYETNRSGFSMAGPKYRAAFRDACLNMMRKHGVIFFKFDGMGGGNKATGAAGRMADDIDAVLDLTRTLRRENSDVFISATVGTWASPFWTLYSDSIWRQGGDTGFHGKGDTRQQWITYRDKFCYERIVQLGPLYPLNSLMLHGPCISDRRAPARMVRNEKSVADEIWSFFGSGTNLQELYITPRVLTKKMWDELATAAKWSRANSDLLVDTHWIGSDPGKAEIYGWASWQPRGGIVVLRNPSDKPGSYELDLAGDLELPDQHLTDYRLKSPRPGQRIGSLVAASVKPLRIKLQLWETLVFEAAPVTGAKKYDAAAYRQQRAKRQTQRVRKGS
ncbi:MAG: enterotoxin [Phycisphaerae bacterium]|jgi:hypothetical protein|nr:enterotoxin [Phycisphaerae bacterium]MDP7287446.1 enterotoxin [Phycisphaerae bacterium]